MDNFKPLIWAILITAIISTMDWSSYLSKQTIRIDYFDYEDNLDLLICYEYKLLFIVSKKGQTKDLKLLKLSHAPVAQQDRATDS